MRTSMTAENGGVLVVGAGPVGLTMAAELARHGIRPRIIDRLREPLPYCRAIGVTPRTLEFWDDMGICARHDRRGNLDPHGAAAFSTGKSRI